MGVGFVSYNVVPPPHTRLFSLPNLDLSYSGLKEFQQSKFEGYGPKTRFEDPDYPDKVYKVVKALYGLHQAPRAWSIFMTLSLALQRKSCVLNLRN
ncbi:hypothetical protein Tco_0198368 [Tanacetum coccineum]